MVRYQSKNQKIEFGLIIIIIILFYFSGNKKNFPTLGNQKRVQNVLSMTY